MFNIPIRSLATIALLLVASCNRGPSDNMNPGRVDTLTLEQDVAVRGAVQTITEADVRTRVNLIADDSMGGRDTPSPGLDKTADYIASEFARMGLEALGDNGKWYQRYDIRMSVIDPAGSSITFSQGEDGSARLELSQDVSRFSRGSPAQALLTMPLVVMGGGETDPAPLAPGLLKGKVLLWAAPRDAEIADERRYISRDERRRALQTGERGGAEAILVAVGEDAPITSPNPPAALVSTSFGGPFLAGVRQSRIAAGAPALAAALNEVRASPGLRAISDPDWAVTFETRFERNQSYEVPNVVGLVRGRDPVLRDEYLVFTAHFDHVGSRCAREGETDRICNGADDNASGTTGLIELAEAFAQPDARPRRSIIFAAVSGEERGLLGSRYFAENPPVPIENIIANINMDHLGRNWRDSIVVIGGEHSDLGELPPAVTNSHPELNIKPLPDQWPEQRIYFRSDHYNFAREGVPILFFTNGFHDDYHRVTDSSDKIDAEKESRVVRYIFYVGHRIANQDDRPRWDPQSYREIVRPERQSP